MTIIFENENSRFMASIPPYTPCLVTVDEKDHDIRLVLQIGSCTLQIMLHSKGIANAYPYICVHELFSDIVEKIHTMVSKHSDYINLNAILSYALSVWETTTSSDADAIYRCYT